MVLPDHRLLFLSVHHSYRSSIKKFPIKQNNTLKIIILLYGKLQTWKLTVEKNSDIYWLLIVEL